MSVYQKESPAHLPGARMAKNKKDGAPPPHSLTSQRGVKSAKRGSWGAFPHNRRWLTRY